MKLFGEDIPDPKPIPPEDEEQVYQLGLQLRPSGTNIKDNNDRLVLPLTYQGIDLDKWYYGRVHTNPWRGCPNLSLDEVCLVFATTEDDLDKVRVLKKEISNKDWNKFSNNAELKDGFIEIGEYGDIILIMFIGKDVLEPT
jgi:hypothetical protein